MMYWFYRNICRTKLDKALLQLERLGETVLLLRAILLLAACKVSPITTGKVFTKMARSDMKEFDCEYLMSRRIISVKVVLFLPDTCHRPVMPGSA